MRLARTWIPFLLATGALAGCATAGASSATDDAMVRCTKYYFQPGTPAMARCVEREARSGQTGHGDTKQADKAYVACVGYGFKPGSDDVARCVQREVHSPGAGSKEGD
jgi:hypothetical protein